MEICKSWKQTLWVSSFFNVMLFLASLIENFVCPISVWYIQEKVVLFLCVSAINKEQVGSPADIKLKTWEQKPFV